MVCSVCAGLICINRDAQNWRISCKARHFVDGKISPFSSFFKCFELNLLAVHNHFAQIFGDHRQSSGEMHADQWTLNVLSQVICASEVFSISLD